MKPNVLIFDIETSYLEGYMFNIYDQNFAHNQLKVSEWSILAYSAKWLGSKEMMYEDVRKQRNKRNDKVIVKKLRDLLDSADIILTKNGKRFDEKVFNARCEKHNIKPPSSFRHVDVEQIVRRKFKLVSYSLDYLCKYFDTKHKKSSHGNFPGMTLWIECMQGNIDAWNEMEKYNKLDVLSTEDVYNKVAKWDNSINFQVYTDNIIKQCSCGSTRLKSKGYNYTNTGKFKRLICRDCGKSMQERTNLLTIDKKKSLLK